VSGWSQALPPAGLRGVPRRDDFAAAAYGLMEKPRAKDRPTTEKADAFRRRIYWPYPMSSKTLHRKRSRELATCEIRTILGEAGGRRARNAKSVELTGKEPHRVD
jgi:hypothetical protein